MTIGQTCLLGFDDVGDEFDYQAQGRWENSNADVLSCNPIDIATASVYAIPNLAALRLYIESSTQPEDGKLAKRILIENQQYDINGVLHYKNHTFLGHWCLVVLQQLRSKVVEAHAGCFTAKQKQKACYVYVVEMNKE